MNGVRNKGTKRKKPAISDTYHESRREQSRELSANKARRYPLFALNLRVSSQTDFLYLSGIWRFIRLFRLFRIQYEEGGEA